MTVTVYVWFANGTSVGHASMKLGDGTYVSLWPGEDKACGKKKSKKGKKQDIHVSECLEDDIEGEERKYDCEFRIHDLNEQRIRRWWHDFDKSCWSVTQNCCQTVVDGLKKGGSQEKLNWFVRNLAGNKPLWDPFLIAQYARALELATK